MSSNRHYLTIMEGTAGGARRLASDRTCRTELSSAGMPGQSRLPLVKPLKTNQCRSIPGDANIPFFRPSPGLISLPTETGSRGERGGSVRGKEGGCA